MDRMWTWVVRVRNLVFRRRWEREAEQEMAFHVEMDTKERIRQGMGPEEARRSALVAFGGTERFRHQARENRWGGTADRLQRDVRYAVRALIKNPGFSSAAIVTLALGVGVNTAMFSVVNTVQLQPLPYPDAHEVVRIQNSWAGSPKGSISPGEFVDFEQRLEGFSAFGAYGFGTVNITREGEPIRASAAFLSSGVFPALGATAAMGRVFDRDEDVANAPVLMISDGFWRSRFAADPDVIGRTATVHRELHPERPERLPEASTSLLEREEAPRFWSYPSSSSPHIPRVGRPA